MSFISRAYSLGDWGANKYNDNFYFDESTDEWEDEKAKSLALLSEALGEILAWISEGSINSKNYKDKVFRKTIAMIWCMRPDLLDNSSLRALSKRGGVGLSHASISKNVAMFTNAFGRFHNGTKTDEAKLKYSKITKRYHRKQKGMGGNNNETR